MYENEFALFTLSPPRLLDERTDQQMMPMLASNVSSVLCKQRVQRETVKCWIDCVETEFRIITLLTK